MEQRNSNSLTLREYATRERITLETAYRRIWNGRVEAKRIDGRWQIFPKQEPRDSATPKTVAAQPARELVSA